MALSTCATWKRRGLFVALVAMLVALLPGCADLIGDPDVDAHQPGELLGSFHVTATRTANSCGEGALGSQPTWVFDVKLARDAGVLYWNNGVEMIQGTLEADAVTFHFDTGIVTDMRTAADSQLPPCSIARHDKAEGVLGAPGGEEVGGFSGSLAYDFAPTPGSMCGDLIDGAMPVFAALPCGFAYKLAGAKVSAASP